MNVAVAGTRLTTDEIAAITELLGVERLPGVTEPEFDGDGVVSAAAGRRSLVARGLAEPAEEFTLGPVLAVIIGTLANASRRLTIGDPGLTGELATVSVSPGSVVIHRRIAEGVHDVAVVEKRGVPEVLTDLLSRYRGTERDQAPDPDDPGVIACLRIHSTGPANSWIEESTVWVGEDGTVALIDAEAGSVEPIRGLSDAVLRTLLEE